MKFNKIKFFAQRLCVVTFCLSFTFFGLHLLLVPSLIGFNRCLPDGISLDTDLGIKVVTHAEWMAAKISMILFITSFPMFVLSILASIMLQTPGDIGSLRILKVFFFINLIVYILALVRMFASAF